MSDKFQKDHGIWHPKLKLARVTHSAWLNKGRTLFQSTVAPTDMKNAGEYGTQLLFCIQGATLTWCKRNTQPE